VWRRGAGSIDDAVSRKQGRVVAMFDAVLDAIEPLFEFDALRNRFGKPLPRVWSDAVALLFTIISFEFFDRYAE
jgi:hypothetical protein